MEPPSGYMHEGHMDGARVVGLRMGGGVKTDTTLLEQQLKKQQKEPAKYKKCL